MIVNERLINLLERRPLVVLAVDLNSPNTVTYWAASAGLRIQQANDRKEIQEAIFALRRVRRCEQLLATTEATGTGVVRRQCKTSADRFAGIAAY